MFLLFLITLFYLNFNCDSFFYKNKKKLFIGASFTSFFIYYFYKNYKNNKGKNNNKKDEDYKEQNEKISKNNLNEDELFNEDYFIDNGLRESKERNAIKVLIENKSFLSYDKFIENVTGDKDNVFNLILKQLNEENNKDNNKDLLRNIDSFMNSFFNLFSEQEGTFGTVYEYGFEVNNFSRKYYKELLEDEKVVNFLGEDLNGRIKDITSIFDKKDLNQNISSKEIGFVKDIKKELNEKYLPFIKKNIDLEKYIEFYKKCFYFSYLNAYKVYFCEKELNGEIKKIDDEIKKIDDEIKKIDDEIEKIDSEINTKNDFFPNGSLGKFLINTGNKKAKEIDENFDISTFNELIFEGDEEKNINPVSLNNLNMRFLEQNQRDTFICSDLHGDITAFYVILNSSLKDAKNFVITGDFSHREFPQKSASGYCNIFMSAILSRYENIIKKKGLNILMLRGNHETVSICQNYGNFYENNILFSPCFFLSEIENAFCAIYPEIAFLNRREKGQKNEFIAFSHGLPHSLFLIENFKNLNPENRIINLTLENELIKGYYKNFFKKNKNRISHFGWSELCSNESNESNEKKPLSYLDDYRGLHINELKYLSKEIDTVHGHQNSNYFVVKDNKDEDLKTKCFCKYFKVAKDSCNEKGHHGHLFLPVSSNNSYSQRVENLGKRNLVFCLLTKDGKFGKCLEDGLDLDNLENVN